MKRKKLSKEKILELVKIEFEAFEQLFQFFAQRSPTAIVKHGGYKDGTHYFIAVFKPKLLPNKEFLNHVMKWKHELEKVTDKAIIQLGGGNLQEWEQAVDFNLEK